MSVSEIDKFSWHVETMYRSEDGEITTRPEPVIWDDGSIRNPDGSAYRHLENADELPGEVLQRVIVLTEMGLIADPNGNPIGMLPLQTFRLPFAQAPTGGLPMWERLAIAMRGEKPPAQVGIVPASMLSALQGHKAPGGVPRR